MIKPNILIIIPNLGRGGAQRVFHQQMQHLSRHFKVLGCVFNWNGSFEEDKTLNIISLDVPGGKTWMHKVYYFILRTLRLRKLKREKNIDVSISHLEGADYVNLLSRGSEKVICWIHGTKKFDENITGLLGLVRHHILMPLVYRRAEKIVTVSGGIQEELKMSIKGVESRIETIYNGFDVEGIQKLSVEKADEGFIELCQKSKVIITHCRLSKQKNLIALIYIYKELLKIASPKLVIIGDGELREELLYACKQMKLKTWACWENLAWSDSCNVFFLGQQQNPFKYLRHASLYIMTSNWEGFPLALCEAMVCKLPVIASDCYTGPREILNPEIISPLPVSKPYYATFGLLMPLANIDTNPSIKVWANEVQRLLENTAQMNKYSKEGIERIKEFDLDSIMAQTVELVETI
jgi:glycosyltransferase involved in cell wall biosynthesis